jgi:hypothetical protein
MGCGLHNPQHKKWSGRYHPLNFSKSIKLPSKVVFKNHSFLDKSKKKKWKNQVFTNKEKYRSKAITGKMY